MRISDWSSDVCSSDLLADLRSVAVEHRGAFAHRLAPVDAQPDTLDDRALPALDQDTRGTGEIRFLEPPLARDRERPKERRVGKECDSKDRYRWAPYR